MSGILMDTSQLALQCMFFLRFFVGEHHPYCHVKSSLPTILSSNPCTNRQPQCGFNVTIERLHYRCKARVNSLPWCILVI